MCRFWDKFKFNLKLGHICCGECCVFHYCSDECYQNRQLFVNPMVQTCFNEISDLKGKWKWHILRTINLPINARMKLLLIRCEYDPKECANCKKYRVWNKKYCSKNVKRNIREGINQTADKLVISES